MTTTESVVARFAAVRRDLDEALEPVDVGFLGWAPRDGMRTVRGLLVEIGATELQVVRSLSDAGPVDFRAAEGRFEGLQTLGEWKEALSAVREETLGAAQTLG